MGTEGPFLGLKRLGREVDHLLPSRTKVKNAWSYTYILPYVFMVWCLIMHWIGFRGAMLNFILGQTYTFDEYCDMDNKTHTDY